MKKLTPGVESDKFEEAVDEEMGQARHGPFADTPPAVRVPVDERLETGLGHTNPLCS
jgi:hypothetical protein